MHFKITSAICSNLDQSEILLSGNGLTLSQVTILDAAKLKEFADNNSEFDENDSLQTGRKHNGKRRNCLLWAISPFPLVFPKNL